MNFFDVEPLTSACKSFCLEPEEFNLSFDNFPLDSLSLSHVNIRSLNKNFSQFSLLYDTVLKHKFSIIGLTEIWQVNDNLGFKLEGYNFECKGRLHGRGGGVGAYIKSNLKYDIVDISVCHTESLWLHLFVGEKIIKIGILYRKPNTDIKEFQDSLVDTLYQLKLDRHQCIIMGDFNIDLMSNTTDDFKTSMQSFGLEQVIAYPTRKTKFTETLIDHIYINFNVGVNCAGILRTDLSDHFPVCILLERPSGQHKSVQKMKSRNFRFYEKEKFHDDIIKAPWHEIYEFTDAGLAYDRFIDIFRNLCDKHAPWTTRNKKPRKGRKPWITQSIMKSIKQKHKLYSKVLASKFNDAAHMKYKRYRNILTGVLRQSKKKYYDHLFEEYKGNSSKTWKTVNELLGKGCQSKQIIDKLQTDSDNSANGNMCTDPQDIVNTLNDFFVSVGPRLAAKIKVQGYDYNYFLGEPVKNSFDWLPITPEEVTKVIRTCDRKKSCGYDNIPVNILVDSAYFVSHPLSYIFNLSFQSGYFPNSMKIARVSPLYKKGSKTDPGNYRPISVLPIVSKVFEKLVNMRLLKFLEKYDLLFKHQYGFREKHSTKLSLISLVNQLVQLQDDGRVTVGIFVDFAKAFDTINHDILLAKLQNYGIRGLQLNWFRDYLTNRCQFVQHNGSKSPLASIICGVPQGSVLGPTLFLLYINDLPRSSDYFSFRLFADDSNIFHSFPTGQSNINLTEISDKLVNIVQWCDANKITINVKKTNFMIIKPRRKKINIVGSVLLGNDPVSEVDSALFVGIYIDKYLTWSVQINNLCTVLRKKVGILFRLRCYVSKKVLLLLYHAFLQSQISYGIEVWGSAAKKSINRVFILQKMAMRAITFGTRMTPSSPLFYSLGVLDVFKLYKHLVATFIFRLTLRQLPLSLCEYFKLFENYYDTRQKGRKFIIPKVKTEHGKASISFVGSKFWNTLPLELKSVKTIRSFSYKLRKYFLCDYIL